MTNVSEAEDRFSEHCTQAAYQRGRFSPQRPAERLLAPLLPFGHTVELQSPEGAVDEQHIAVMLVRRYLARIRSRSNVDEASADHGSKRSSAVQHDLVQHYPCREVNGRFVTASGFR